MPGKWQHVLASWANLEVERLPGAVVQRISMRAARLAVVIIGIVLPYLARVPGGTTWLRQYTSGGVGALLLLEGFNAIAWGAILATTFLYRRPSSVIFPALFGFGYLAYMHATLDLGSDAQAGIALIFIPIYALLPVLVGAVIGWFYDRRRRR